MTTPNHQAELLPCPCCKSTRLIAEWPWAPVYCKDCGLRAVSHERWNTRPASHEAELAEALEDCHLLIDGNAWYSSGQMAEIARYARHSRSCTAVKGANYGEESCDCGLNATRARIAKAKAGAA